MSTTYIAGIVSLLTLALPAIGIHVVDQGQVSSTLSEVVGLLAVLYTFYGRYKAGGINAFGFRRQP